MGAVQNCFFEELQRCVRHLWGCPTGLAFFEPHTGSRPPRSPTHTARAAQDISRRLLWCTGMLSLSLSLFCFLSLCPMYVQAEIIHCRVQKKELVGWEIGTVILWIPRRSAGLVSVRAIYRRKLQDRALLELIRSRFRTLQGGTPDLWP